MTPQGNASPRLHIIVDRAQAASPIPGLPFSGWQFEFLRTKLLRAGIKPSEVKFSSLADIQGSHVSNHLSPLIVGMGGETLSYLTGKKGIDKWNLSPLRTLEGAKFFGTFDFKRIQKQWELGLYLEMTLMRAAEEIKNPSDSFGQPEEKFYLNPGIEETLDILRRLEDASEIAVDIETGYGQINTIGFAWSDSEAIAINVLPDRAGDSTYYELMSQISRILQSGSTKIFQNFIYDCSYLSAYGIRVRGKIFDTMWAMKVLWPEFKSGLDNVGRFYTKKPYWKDDGKVTDEEGSRKAWGNIRDWVRHYTYNCRDTTGTFEAARNQRRDMDDRGIRSFFESYMLRLTDPIREMCATGMPVCSGTRDHLRSEVKSNLDRLLGEFQREVGYPLNPRSPQQMMNYLKGLGISLPKKYDKEKGVYKESADASSIKKIRLKIPENKALALLQEIKKLDKAYSSYLNFEIRPDSRLSYSLNGAGTESLRWSGHKDPWDRGFNIQTMPREGGEVSIKSMFKAPEGKTFIEIDLRQAESRFVAYDSADETLIRMLESDSDVHSYVGEAIMKQKGLDPASVSKEEFKATWRQLGKKAGHGLNYGMKPRVFVETVFNELDMVISLNDAELISEAYFNLFPGIKRWHSSIRREIYSTRRLSAPSGWERYFYGRPEDSLKEALSWRPQHTIPWITNHLMLHLCDERHQGKFKFNLIAQVHDSLILLANEEDAQGIADSAYSLIWHPEVTLAGGKMKIPVEAKKGRVMSEMKDLGQERK